MAEITGNAKWPTIDLHCAEIPEGQRGTKEVYVSVPVELVTALLQKIGYTVTKP